jgi:multidrug efflux pump subunit AcrB
MLIVGWFQNFKTPIVMMLAIPLSIGIWSLVIRGLFHGNFFIGMIALAGLWSELGFTD